MSNTVEGNKVIAKDDSDEEESEFIPCERCDGHPACEDFGCAIKHGLERMVGKNKELTSDDL